MAMKTLEDLFVDKLKDIHDAEKRITRALPKMIKAANSEEVSQAFEEHLRMTEGQINRLEQIFQEMGKTPGRKPCHGMMGILEEGEESIQESAEAPASVADAALIGGAQEVEHYEIAAYGCLKTWAHVLGKGEAARLLQQTLHEEEQTDRRLTKLAGSINQQAMQERDNADSKEDEGNGVEVMSRRGRNGSRSGNGSRSSRMGNGSRASSPRARSRSH